MTNIQWTDVTDNPLRVQSGGHWCRKISPGCANCYAEKLNLNSFFKGSLLPYSGASPVLNLDEELIKSWSRSRKPKKRFVCSMTDLFGEWVPIKYQLKIFEAMWAAQKKNQIFQILTKRPDKAHCAIRAFLRNWDLPRIPDNIWIGASIESPKYVWRSDELAKIPCNRFWSCEPLLEGFTDIRGQLETNKIGWVIIGGESGGNARIFEENWAVRMIWQAQEVGVPVFVKQLGSNPRRCRQRTYYRDRKGGNIEEWSEDLKIREFPERM